VVDVTYRLARQTYRHAPPGQPETIIRVGRSWWEGTLTVGEVDGGSIREGGPVLDVGDRIEVPLGVFPVTARADRALGLVIVRANEAGWILSGSLPDDVGVGDFLRAGGGRLVRIEGTGAPFRVSPEAADAAGAVVQVRSVLAEVTEFPSTNRSGSGIHGEMTYGWRYVD